MPGLLDLEAMCVLKVRDKCMLPDILIGQLIVANM